MGTSLPAGNTNLFFEATNRNKKSIALDLRKEKGRQVVYRVHVIGDAQKPANVMTAIWDAYELARTF